MAVKRPPRGASYQPKHITQPLAYWRQRGLQMVFLGNRCVWNRDDQASGDPPTVVGGPKNNTGPYGVAQGFGSTYGTGLTDYLGGNKLSPPKAGGRSILSFFYAKTTGGGGYGRIYQDASGSGATVGEAFYISTAPGVTFAFTDVSSSLTTTWTPSFTVPTGRWCSVGIAVPFRSTGGATTARAFLDGKFIASDANANGVTTGSNAPTNMTWGNRAAAPGNERCFDGMLGPTLIFDGVLDDRDFAVLSANPWRVFAPLERRIWAPAAGGGATITGTIGTAVASGLTGTVNANRTIAGALGTATASGFRGVVNANRTISGALGTAVASGLAGNVNANRTIAGALGTATASGFQGAVTNGNTTTITGSLGTAVASGFTGGVTWNRYIAGVLGVATASGFTGGVANGASSGGDGGTSKRKYYIRRRKQILIFDSVAQVDAYIEAEEEAAEAIAKAKSRGAKKRVIARVFKEQPEAVEITPLAELIESYKLPYNVGELIASENYQQIVDIQRIIQRIRDDEDEELLLLLA